MGILGTILKQFYKRNERLCPSCNEHFYPGDCEIVATVPSEKQMAEAPREDSFAQHFARWEPKPLTGEKFTLALARRKCPHCGYLLPYNVERAERLNIAIVGDVTSGKSHYIAALIQQIQQGKLLRPDQQITFRTLTREREQQYTDEYFKPLFEQKQVIPFNQRATDATHKPLIYELSVKQADDRPPRSVNLTIYDTSGEDYVLQDRLVQYGRFVLSANAIIFLADPVTMPEIRDKLPSHIDYSTARGQSATVALNAIIELLERYRNKTTGSRLNSIPIAITLSKSDLLKYLTPISQQYSFMKPHMHKGGIDLKDLDTVDREVRKVLTDFGDPTLLPAAKSFSRLKFFATSATGYSPDEDGYFPAIEPRRCLDPVLWILYELGMISPDMTI
jgi:hypothetical protein